MAYQALYRKYRPTNFDEVVGQRHIVQTLRNAIKKNRIAHAYLFCGPRGTGKTSIAKIFARTLNCTQDNPPCIECENCRLSLSGNHPDIVELDAASNNGVDEVRALIDRVGYAPLQGRYKVYIIDEVHMMTTGAFNALLKTIEEPPAHVVFIFATTEPHKVLPTILSRCQRYDFSKVSSSDIQSRLAFICQQEGILVDEEALTLIADLADGGMRDALSILDQCIAYEQEHLTAQAVREIYGVVQPEELAQLSSYLVPDQVDQALEFLEEIEKKGMDLKRLIADLISLYKDSLLLDLSKKTKLLSEKRKTLLQQSFLIHPTPKRVSMLNDLMALYNKLAFSSNVMDYLETILLKAALYQVSVYPSFSNAKPEISSPSSNGLRSLGESNETVDSPTLSNNQPSIEEDLPKKSISSPKTPDLASIFWQKNVSRETTSKNHKSNALKDENFLLSLLVGANKEEKEHDQVLLKENIRYVHDIEYAKFATTLQEGMIVASGPTYLVYSVRDEVNRDFMNGLQESQGYEIYFEALLEKPKKLFVLTIKEAQKLIQTFVNRKKENTLPPAAQIDLTRPLESLSLTDQLKERFQNQIEVRDD